MAAPACNASARSTSCRQESTKTRSTARAAPASSVTSASRAGMGACYTAKAAFSTQAKGTALTTQQPTEPPASRSLLNVRATQSAAQAGAVVKGAKVHAFSAHRCAAGKRCTCRTVVSPRRRTRDTNGCTAFSHSRRAATMQLPCTCHGTQSDCKLSGPWGRCCGAVPIASFTVHLQTGQGYIQAGSCSGQVGLCLPACCMRHS
jgi:hypothetical protein